MAAAWLANTVIYKIIRYGSVLPHSGTLAETDRLRFGMAVNSDLPWRPPLARPAMVAARFEAKAAVQQTLETLSVN
jgi:hypothetical protein